MNPEYKYLYANFLCKDVLQYVSIIAVVYADIDKSKMENFWQERKLIPDQKPRAKWNNNVGSKYTKEIK